MEKWAVCAASPISTTFSWLQLSHSTRLKLSQAEPRRWRALVISRLPPRLLAKIASHLAIVSSWLMASKPRLRQVGSEHSTMKVGCLGIELVSVHPNPALVGLLEDEGEGVVEFLVRAEPDVLAVPHVDIGLEDVRQRAAHLGVDAVRRHDQVVTLVGLQPLDLGLEPELHPERPRPVLQDVEQPLAADAAEAVPRGARDGAAIVDGDVVPVDEVARISAALTGSAALRLSSVSSESTTPQPNVSYGRLRSITTISCGGRAASWQWRNKGRPALRPDRQRATMPPSGRSVGTNGAAPRWTFQV